MIESYCIDKLHVKSKDFHMKRRFRHICSILLAALLLRASIPPGIHDAALQTESTAKETAAHSRIYWIIGFRASFSLLSD